MGKGEGASRLYVAPVTILPFFLAIKMIKFFISLLIITDGIFVGNI